MSTYYYDASKYTKAKTSHTTNQALQTKMNLKSKDEIKLSHSNDKISEKENFDTGFMIITPNGLAQLAENTLVSAAPPEDSVAKNFKFTNIFQIKCFAQPQNQNPEIPYIQPQTSRKASSGFMVKMLNPHTKKEEMLVLTNCHAVTGCVKGEGGVHCVDLIDCNSVTTRGTVVAKCFQWDLALIKPSEKAIEVAKSSCFELKLEEKDLSSSIYPSLGEVVYIPGHPLGELSMALTTGRVTSVISTNYAISNMVGPVIVTDTTVNQGNSGGPVIKVNSTTGKIELVGVIFEGVSGAQKTNYIIPEDKSTHLVLYFLGEKAKRGENSGIIEMPFLHHGLELDTIDSDEQRLICDIDKAFKKFDVKVGNKKIGVRVKSSEANKKIEGLQAEDIIFEINGHLVSSDGTFNINNLYNLKLDSFNADLRPGREHLDIRLMRKEGNELKMLKLQAKANTSEDVVLRHNTENPEEYCYLAGSLVVPMNINILVKDFTTNQVSFDELKSIQLKRSQDVSQALILYSLEPTEEAQKLGKLYKKRIVSVNGKHVSDLRSLIIAVNHPIELDGRKFIQLDSESNERVVIDAELCSKSLAEFQSSKNAPPYYCCELEKVKELCPCQKKDLNFSDSQITCSACKKGLASFDENFNINPAKTENPIKKETETKSKMVAKKTSTIL